MWEFMQLQWRVERLWSTLLNNKYVSLAQLVQRGELDEVLEGISEKERPEDDYTTRLQLLRELVARGKEFLDAVDAEIKRAIEEIQNPYGDKPGKSVSPVLEMPIDEE
jgi:hypothetical protein